MASSWDRRTAFSTERDLEVKSGTDRDVPIVEGGGPISEELSIGGSSSENEKVGDVVWDEGRTGRRRGRRVRGGITTDARWGGIGTAGGSSTTSLGFFRLFRVDTARGEVVAVFDGAGGATSTMSLSSISLAFSVFFVTGPLSVIHEHRFFVS